MSIRILTYAQAFDLLGIKYNDKAKETIKYLEKDGHTEKSICFAVWKSHEKLLKLKEHSSFWSIFQNEVRKWSWSTNDIRWANFNKNRGDA